jgi:hypothetical protein
MECCAATLKAAAVPRKRCSWTWSRRPDLASLTGCPVEGRCLRNSTADPIVEGVIVVAIMVALLAVVLIADRVAVICAQDRLARQIQDWGSPVSHT